MTYYLRSDTITFEAALRDLRGGSDRARAQAAHALGDIVAADERQRAVPALITALADARPEVRAEAALSLGDLESESAVQPLIGRFGDPVPAVRQAAAIAIGKLGFASAFDALAKALREGPPDLRFQAATSLAEIDHDRAREPLLAALSDSDAEVIGAVALALGAIDERRAVAPLTAALASWERPHTRFDIAFSLTELCAGRDELERTALARCAAVLAEFVSDASLGWDAIEAIERISPHLARPGTLLEPLGAVVSRRFVAPRLKLRAAAAVLAISARVSDAEERRARDAREALLDGLRSRKLDRCALAVELVRTHGGAWAIGELEGLRSRRLGRHLTEEIDAALAALKQPSSAGA